MSVSRRPVSASHSGYGQRSNSKTSGGPDLLSFEDIIIAKYLEELRKPPVQPKNG